MTPSVPEPSISSAMPSYLRTEASTGILVDRTESFDTAAELEIKLKNRPKSRSRNRVRMNSTPVQISHARDSRIHTPTADEESTLAQNERDLAAQEKTRTASPLPASPAASPNANLEKPPRESSLNSSQMKDSKLPKEAQDKPKSIRRKGLDKFLAAFWANRHVAWIYPKTKDWNEMKPVIRCAVAVSHQQCRMGETRHHWLTSVLSGMDRVRLPLDLSCRAGHGPGGLFRPHRRLYRPSQSSVSCAILIRPGSQAHRRSTCLQYQIHPGDGTNLLPLPLRRSSLGLGRPSRTMRKPSEDGRL